MFTLTEETRVHHPLRIPEWAMIDKVKARVPFQYPDPAVQPDRLPFRGRQHLRVQGPSCGKAELKVPKGGPAHGLLIEFNPATFFQQHNVFGWPDLGPLFVEVLEHVERELNLPQPASVRRAWRLGDLNLIEVHVAASIRVPGKDQALTAVHLLGVSCRTPRHLAHFYESTAYWGTPDSPFLQLAAYGKHAELEACGKLESRPERLQEWVRPMMRLELRVRSKGLAAEGLTKANDWGPVVPGQLLRKYLTKKVSCHESWTPCDDRFSRMDWMARAVWRSWRDGDLGGMTRGTKDKYRKHIKEAIGIDIMVPYAASGEQLQGLVGLTPAGLLAMPFAEPPEWAHGDGQLYIPKDNRLLPSWPASAGAAGEAA